MSAAGVSAPIRRIHSNVRLAICYKNFAAGRGISHIGLGVSAMQNARALRAAGYIVEIWPILSSVDLIARLEADSETSRIAQHVPVTHVVISAPWIPTAELAGIINRYPAIEFAVVSHSNIGFLQADPRAIDLLRSGAALAQSAPSFHVAANSPIFRNWWRQTYQTQMILLPNMYPTEGARTKPQWRGGRLRIGCFCAIRPYKNVLTGAAAALEVGVRLGVTDLELWISGGRMEGGGGTIYQAIMEMYKNLPRAKVVSNTWQSWPAFLTTVGAMDLMIQPSYTEGFSMVTADGIVQGVATVVSDAIYWAPSNWKTGSDAAAEIASKAIALLHDPSAVQEGIEALVTHNSQALASWHNFLTLYP